MVGEVFYNRPHNSRFHKKGCVMLENGDFRKLRYAPVTSEEIKNKKLEPCPICNPMNEERYK